jgi:alpha-beta hydrolase superfamily lysophospholipase
MAFDIDVRHVAAAIKVPTLIVHTTGDKVSHVENARFLARTIQAARYVELPGKDLVHGSRPMTSSPRSASSSPGNARQ